MASEYPALQTQLTELSTACASTSSPQAWLGLFQQASRQYFADSDAEFGRGQFAVMTVPEACKNAISSFVDAITEAETAINTYADTLPEAQKTETKTWIQTYKTIFTYGRDAQYVTTLVEAYSSNAAFTTQDAVIGLCLYQPAVSQTAACWGYQNRYTLGNPNPGFDGYALTPATWNALSAANQKLDPTILASSKLSTASQDVYKVFQCIEPANNSVIQGGFRGAMCVKGYAPASMASATDPPFVLGATTVYIYNSTRTTAQATAANRNLYQGTGFQGAAFYSYDVNIQGALSGMALSAAAISALVLSYF